MDYLVVGPWWKPAVARRVLLPGRINSGAEHTAGAAAAAWQATVVRMARPVQGKAGVLPGG